MSKPKILIMDIESLPNRGYFWNIFDDRGLPLAFVEQPKAVVTISYKWHGEKKVTTLYADTPYDDADILEKYAKVHAEADYVVGHFIEGFDVPYVSARLFANKLPPLSPVAMIDTYKLAKKHFGKTLNSNKLDHLGTILGVGNKTSTSAQLWVDCANGSKKAIKEMGAYNKQDVLLLEKIYDKLLPYTQSRINRNLFSDGEIVCDSCGSHKVQKRGVSVTKATMKQKYQCQDCGHWFTKKLEKKKDVATNA